MKAKNISYWKIFTLLISIVLISVCAIFGVACQKANANDIGIAWTTEGNYDSLQVALNEIDAQSTVLPEVKFYEFNYDGEKVSNEYLDANGMLTVENAEKIKARPYDKTNVAEVAAGHKAIIFPGGTDVCPSLYKEPQAWYNDADKPSFNVARDVSDYILMAYCLDNDIPVMGICRGMQMYNVVSGGTMIQDLPTYFSQNGIAYNNEHIKSGELDGKKVYGNHPVNIIDKHSLMYQIWGQDTLLSPPSLHHQAVLAPNTENTKLVATSTVNGFTTVEALERADGKSFGLFVQFHPEISAAHWIKNEPDKDRYMSLEDSLKPFRYLVEKAGR